MDDRRWTSWGHRRIFSVKVNVRTQKGLTARGELAAHSIADAFLLPNSFVNTEHLKPVNLEAGVSIERKT
nr:hypothetical protein CFP56_76741 [Quercus suber]